MDVTEIADLWALIEVRSDAFEGHKVLASFLGGYLTTDGWRLNSGIVRIEKQEQAYLIHGVSGSVYMCPKGAYGMSPMAESQINRIIDASPTGAGRVLREDEALSVMRSIFGVL